MSAFSSRMPPPTAAARRMAQKRKYLRRRRAAFALALALCAVGLAAAARFAARFFAAGTPPPQAGLSGAAAPLAEFEPGESDWDAETAAALAVLAQELPEVQAMLDRPGQWPQQVAALLAHNREALDFVLAYPRLKDTEPPDTVGDLERGSFPLLLQWDERWGCVPYAGSILAVSGCGPTALAMVACGLTGDDTLTPARLARWAQDNGYATEAGTSWELMRTGCEAFGLQAQELPLSEDAVLAALQSGQPIICSMRPGDFTTTGHFIVLAGAQGGKLQVLDPNSRQRSEQQWEYSRLEHQIKNLWAYSRKEA